MRLGLLIRALDSPDIQGELGLLFRALDSPDIQGEVRSVHLSCRKFLE